MIVVKIKFNIQILVVGGQDPLSTGGYSRPPGK